ncbi:MAG: hypothetical protein E2598_10870 [Sphingobium sp.]|nr:hypothetical protein [Sphingobium sp.]
MQHRLSLIASGAFAALLMASPALAQNESAGPSAERIRQVIVYGDDACPQSDSGEIVVCARQEEKERYRIPKELREAPDFGSTRNEAWANRVRSIEYVGRSGTESCSPSGLGGVTGCFAKIAAQAKAERRMTGEKSWSDQVAAERERRLSTIDADSQAIEERAKAEEAEAAARALDHQNDPGK